jgi:cytochrome P450
MQSVYTETLRLRVAVVIQRSPTVPDFKIDNWSFSEGKMIMANHWIAARDEAVWNTGRLGENGSQQYPVDEFWGERFLEYPDDPLSGPLRKPERAAEPGANGGEKSISDDRQAKFTMDGTTGHYFPYSGGLKMCPGRFFAKQEIIGATAMILSAYDIEFVDVEAAKKIKPDMNYFPFGAVPPKGNIAVRIRRRRAT